MATRVLNMDCVRDQQPHAADNTELSTNVQAIKGFKPDEHGLQVFASDYYGVAVCSGGEATLKYGFDEYKVVKDTIIFLFGREQVFDIIDGSSDLTFDFLLSPSKPSERRQLIDAKTMMSLYRYFVENKQYCLQLTATEAGLVENFMDLLNDLETLSHISVMQSTLSAFADLLGYILRNHTKERQAMVSSRQMDYFERFIAAVREHYQQQRSVGFYAALLYITPKYLSTIIKDMSGKSATEWINDFVIEEAKKMLLFTNMSVQEIAYSLNFTTQSFFGKFFKRHIGMSPSQFRVAAAE